MKKLLTVSALSCFACYCNAETKTNFSGELGVGVEQESTQIIDLIDTVQNADNSARVVQINLNFDLAPTQRDELSLSVNYIDKNFQQNDRFDSRLSIISGSYSREFGNYTLGVRNQLILSNLAGERFLNMKQTSPYISFFMGRKWFANLSYIYADKNLQTNPERSATSQELSADVYHFFKGINHYLLFGYRVRNEDATSDLFNYNAEQIRISWLKRVKLGGLFHKLRVNWRYQQRDYEDVINPDIDGFRVDNRRQWEVQWESQMSDDWAVLFNYRRNEQDSTLTTASYDQSIYGVRAEYRF